MQNVRKIKMERIYGTGLCWTRTELGPTPKSIHATLMSKAKSDSKTIPQWNNKIAYYTNKNLHLFHTARTQVLSQIPSALF